MTAATALRAVTGLAGVLAAWEALSRSGLVDRAFVPPPSTVTLALGDLVTDREFLRHAVSTGLSWMIAVLAAAVLGVTLGLLLGYLPVLRWVLQPLVEVLRPLPSVALIPLVIVLLGSDAQTKISLAVFAATWPILISTLHALDEIEPRLVDITRIFHIPRRQRLLWHVLPSIAPVVLTGIRLSAAIALIVLVGTEFLAGGGVGIGQAAYLWGSSAGRMDLVLAVTVLAATANCAVDLALSAAQQRWMPWASRGATA
ncbi:NitT/TauT family transport system permease protein [Lentzea xinjiangensis]|uniref:NitT/TauT family transport system permease protein n=1 Tax=Lentzea xinjiangensis TaxID=402600 RepID=A0A1H9W5F7_9PSEU|nr:ABC transporter permease subunit [Lentzea xinjiangensis]SES29095.1 NitT/TauT family transport system permease protein [Lentzea xinjiangensis]